MHDFNITRNLGSALTWGWAAGIALSLAAPGCGTNELPSERAVESSQATTNARIERVSARSQTGLDPRSYKNERTAYLLTEARRAANKRVLATITFSRLLTEDEWQRIAVDHDLTPRQFELRGPAGGRVWFSTMLASTLDEIKRRSPPGVSTDFRIVGVFVEGTLASLESVSTRSEVALVDVGEARNARIKAPKPVLFEQLRAEQ